MLTFPHGSKVLVKEISGMNIRVGKCINLQHCSVRQAKWREVKIDAERETSFTILQRNKNYKIMFTCSNSVLFLFCCHSSCICEHFFCTCNHWSEFADKLKRVFMVDRRDYFQTLFQKLLDWVASTFVFRWKFGTDCSSWRILFWCSLIEWLSPSKCKQLSSEE